MPGGTCTEDYTKLNIDEKTVSRCYKYCVRNFSTENLLGFENECIITCAQKLANYREYMTNEDLYSYCKTKKGYQIEKIN